MQYAIDVFPTVLDQLFYSKFLYLLVFALQFLKSQSYAANAGLIKAFKG